MPIPTPEFPPGFNGIPMQPLNSGIWVAITRITPEIATSWITQRSNLQRRLVSKNVSSICADIKNGMWMLNGETIVFDERGEILNGQHRLHAVILSELPIDSLVVVGVETQVYASIDQTSSKTAAQVLKAKNYTYASAVAAAAAAIYTKDQYDEYQEYSRKFSAAMIEKVVEMHPGLPEIASATLMAGRIVRSPAVVIFCYYYLSRISEKDADFFFERLGSGEDLSSGDPILALRNRFIKGERKIPFKETVGIIYKAWNLFRSKSSIKFIKFQGSSEFPEPI